MQEIPPKDKTLSPIKGYDGIRILQPSLTSRSAEKKGLSVSGRNMVYILQVEKNIIYPAKVAVRIRVSWIMEEKEAGVLF